MTEAVATTVNVGTIDPSTLPPGSPERAAAMTEKYVSRHDPLTEIEEQAQAVPDKFVNKDTGEVNVQALLASYKALEARFSTQAPTATVTPPAAVPGVPDATSATTPPATGPDAVAAAISALVIPEGTPAPEAIAATVAAAGLDPAVLQAEIVSGGKLTDASTAALVAAGVPPALITAHTETVKEMIRLQSEANLATATSYAGGPEALQAMLGWAKDNLTDAEKTPINKLLNGPDWKLGLDALKARSGAASRTAGEPTLTSVNRPGAPAIQGYQTVNQRTADMNSPKYRTDPAFRAMVSQKMAVSRYELDK